MLTDKQKKLAEIFSTDIIPTIIKNKDQFEKLHENLPKRQECKCSECKCCK